jgi:hypothetical protein
MNNCFNKYQKQPRTIIMANNKRQKEIEHVLIVKNEMINNKIDDKLINEYINEQYKNINLEYETKIKTYWAKQNKINTNKNNKININKNIEISVLIQNKNFLEEAGYTQEYIEQYIDNYYQKINNKYIEKNKENNKNNKNNKSTFVESIVDFIE